MFETKLEFKAKGPYDLRISAETELFCGVESGVDRLSDGTLVRYILKQKGSTEKPSFEVKVRSKKKLSQEELTEVKANLKHYYEFDLDISDFYKLGKKDEVLGIAQKNLRGMRLIGVEKLFDCSWIVICSQNTTFKICSYMVENLKKKFGEEFEGDYAFPTPEAIANASISDLKKCKLGYRAAYVKDLAKSFVSGELSYESLEKMASEKAREELMKIKGIGPYTADVIVLYGLLKRDNIYSDVLVRKAISQLYFKSKEITDEEVKDFGRKRWGKWAGMAVIYILKDLKNLSKEFGLSLKWI